MGTLDENQERILKIVDRNSRRLEKIMHDLFTLYQANQGTSFLEYEKINLKKTIQDCIDDFVLVLEERNLKINYTFQGEPPLISCDELKIIQVLDAVINNAIKFTPDYGEIEIFLRYPSYNIHKKYDLNAEQYIEIAIKDNGIGIPDNKLIKIFDKFVELSDIEMHHSSQSEFMGGGTGLGLSLSKAIVEKHRGFIWAEQRVEKGAKIYIVLPINEPYVE